MNSANLSLLCVLTIVMNMNGYYCIIENNKIEVRTNRLNIFDCVLWISYLINYFFFRSFSKIDTQ